MALIPGTLPSDTCYGTPQDLLELFAQYLDVPAFALNSKVVFATVSTGLTADVIWFNTTVAANPILNITVSGGFVDYVNNYLVNLATVTAATGDFVLVQDISDSNKSKKVTAQTIANLAVITPANGSITAPMLNGAQTGTAPIFGVRAWVNFNGIGTLAINASGNVSSVTDNSIGNYTVNFNTALPTANYTVSGFSVAGTLTNLTGASHVTLAPSGSFTYLPLLKSTSQVQILTGNPNTGNETDSGNISVTVVG